MFDQFFFSRHLEEDEHVSRIVHKHWLMGLKFLVWSTVSFLLSVFALTVVSGRAGYVVVAMWSCASLVWWFRNFLDYYLDAWIITDHGIVDLEWIGWFHRQSSRILYSDIQGVSTEIHGIAGTLWRYGTITVEKISTGTTVSLSHVKRPRSVESLILKNMEAYVHGKNLKNARHVEELITRVVAERMQEGEFAPEDRSEAEKPSGRTTKRSFTTSRLDSR